MTTNKTLIDGTLTRVPLRCIVDHDEIKHRELDREWVSTLSKDIERNGLDNPLFVWNGGGDKGKQVELDNGKVVPATFLVAGCHRRAALRELFKRNAERYKELFPEGVPVIVSGGEVKDALARHLRENVQRRDMPAEQVLPVIRRMRDDYGMKQKEIAKSIGKSEAWVSQIFDIEETLGEEGAEEVSKGGVQLSEAREAARKVKAAKKAGKPTSAKEELQKVKAKASLRKAKGKVREDKRVSAKKVWARYIALPKMNLGAKLGIAEAAMGYLAGDEEYDLPAELSADVEAETKKSKKTDEDDE